MKQLYTQTIRARERVQALVVDVHPEGLDIWWHNHIRRLRQRVFMAARPWSQVAMRLVKKL